MSNLFMQNDRDFTAKNNHPSYAESKPILSIIIPVYNVEKYIADCLKSLLRNARDSYLTKIEIIIVDDGSTDNSLQIVKTMATEYSCVKYFSKSNGGLSDARNFGIKKASGEYYSFIDSDDIVHPQFLKIIVDCIEKTNFDILSFNFIKFFGDKYEEYNCSYENHYLRQVSIDFYNDKPVFAWNKIYKKTLFSGIEFHRGWFYEDVALIPLLIDRAKIHFHIDFDCYFYRQRRGAITFFNDNKYLDILKGVSYLYENSQSKYIKSVIINQYFTLVFLSLRLPMRQCLSNLNKISHFYIKEFNMKEFTPVLCVRQFPFNILKKTGKYFIYPVICFKPIIIIHKLIKTWRGR
ncbi:MAG: glycosyltransferase family 2 protein [Kluyvera sp.]|uniref:glycosyltransferase family 2 protein n=1 Tax=Kluyvera sp. TaxID=1538228 RepID=UPI003A897E57